MHWRGDSTTLLNATANGDPSVVAAICGHGVAVSLNTYNQCALQRQLAAVQALDNALQAPAARVALKNGPAFPKTYPRPFVR
jgi:hypothetical protein